MDRFHSIGWPWRLLLLGWAAALGVSWATLCAADAAPATLLIVSPDRPPYVQVATAIQPEGWTVRVVHHVPPQHPVQAQAVVALGHKAWSELQQNGYSGVIWVAMVSQRPVGGQGTLMGGLLLEPDMDQMLRQIRYLFPDAHRIGVLFDRTKAPEIFPMARGVTLIPLPVDPDHPVWPSSQLSDERIDLLWPLPHPALYRAGVDDLLWVEILRRHLPAIAPSPQLMGKGPVVAWQYDWLMASRWLSQAIALGVPQWGRHPVGAWEVDPHVARLIGMDPVRLQHRIEEGVP